MFIVYHHNTITQDSRNSAEEVAPKTGLLPLPRVMLMQSTHCVMDIEE